MKHKIDPNDEQILIETANRHAVDMEDMNLNQAEKEYIFATSILWAGDCSPERCFGIMASIREHLDVMLADVDDTDETVIYHATT